MPGEQIPKKSTNQFMRQGQTSTAAFGNDPSTEAKGQAGAAAKDLKP
jgi:hypothetical protein